MNWYLGVFKNYAGFSGRARRKEYWMFVLFHMIVAAVLLGERHDAPVGSGAAVAAAVRSPSASRIHGRCESSEVTTISPTSRPPEIATSAGS